MKVRRRGPPRHTGKEIKLQEPILDTKDPRFEKAIRDLIYGNLETRWDAVVCCGD